MSWEVRLTSEVQKFIGSLQDEEKVRVAASIALLKEQGPNLGRPYADVIKTSRHKNMKELRIPVKSKQFRVFFAFDEERQAILLLGGDKISHGVDAFYEELVPLADDLFDQHLAHMRKQRLAEGKVDAARRGKKLRKPR